MGPHHEVYYAGISFELNGQSLKMFKEENDREGSLGSKCLKIMHGSLYIAVICNAYPFFFIFLFLCD